MRMGMDRTFSESSVRRARVLSVAESSCFST